MILIKSRINLIKLIALTILAFNNIYAIDKKSEHIDNNLDTAIFAMGCFWCAQVEFDNLDGVKEVVVGYAGGTKPKPTYQNHQGYKEAIKIYFDASKISYKKLLDTFWHNIDPFDAKGQFCDQGFAYISAIYYKNTEQLNLAKKAKQEISDYFKKKAQPYTAISTETIKATTFYKAEDYHQDYKQKNPVKYKFYRWNCGRDARLDQVWR